jgi:hypothetical protein
MKKLIRGTIKNQPCRLIFLGTANLLAQAEVLDQILIGFLAGGSQVVEQPTTAAYQLQQTGARIEVFLVPLKVVGKLGDALRKKSDLNLGGTGITFAGLVLFYEIFRHE